MDSPIVGIQIRIDDLKRGAGLEHEAIDAAVLGEPLAHYLEVGSRQLPFHLASILGTRTFLHCRM